jgi:hypothetical protein
MVMQCKLCRAETNSPAASLRCPEMANGKHVWGETTVASPEEIHRPIRPHHYTALAIEPWDFIVKNKLGYCEGNVIKYVCRWQNKNGVEDLRKAKAYLDRLIEEEDAKA